MSLYDLDGHLQSESALSSGSVAYDYIWLGNIPVAQEDVGGQTHWTVTDHLGTPVIQTNSAGSIYWQADYSPTGGIYALRTSDAHQPLRMAGQEAEEFAVGNPNGLSGRYYNQARWYRPVYGRYTQADPLQYGSGSYSLYAFANNNALNYGDPAGLSCIDLGGFTTNRAGLALIGLGVAAIAALTFEGAIAGVAGAAAEALGAAAGALAAAVAGAAASAAAGYTSAAIASAAALSSLAQVAASIGGAAGIGGAEAESIDEIDIGGATDIGGIIEANGSNPTIASADFAASSGGTVFPIPSGAIPQVIKNGLGFYGGSGGNGFSPATTSLRIMDPIVTGRYPSPSGYGVYNQLGQTINPFTGRTLLPSDPISHIQIISNQ